MPLTRTAALDARTSARLGRALAAGVTLLFAAAHAMRGEVVGQYTLFPASVPASEYFQEGDQGARELTSDIVRAGEPAPAEIAHQPASDTPPGKLPFWEMHNPAVAAEALRPLPPPGTPEKPFWDTKTTLTTAGTFVFGTLYAASGLWEFGDLDFHFKGDGWFGPNTYAGGADKVSHFTISATVARELTLLYDMYGKTRTQSLALGFGITAFTGLLVEIGDGLTPYGFSWQDLTVDVLGSATGVFLTRHGLNDVFGLRLGKVPTTEPVSDDDKRYLGSHYGQEIYSADFKLAGIARRAKFEPSVARFLLVSVTYQTKGYDFVPQLPDRQRLVGFELGLNFPEILAAVGVPETKWWGLVLYKAFTFFRIPFTSFGWRYDLNAKKWHGPDSGTIYYR